MLGHSETPAAEDLDQQDSEAWEADRFGLRFAVVF